MVSTLPSIAVLADDLDDSADVVYMLWGRGNLPSEGGVDKHRFVF
jgi:hypothetical protein